LYIHESFKKNPYTMDAKDRPISEAVQAHTTLNEVYIKYM